MIHLLNKDVDTIPVLVEAYAKSQPSDSTLRQLMWVGFKLGARTRHIPMLYKLQQEQVQIPNNETWDWEFDILLNHLTTKVEQASDGQGAAPAGAPAAPAGDAPAPAGDAPAAAPAAE